MSTLSKMLFATALASPDVQRLIHRYEQQKPDFYKISLSKAERKGKTPEEITQLRIEKYERQSN